MTTTWTCTCDLASRPGRLQLTQGGRLIPEHTMADKRSVYQARSLGIGDTAVSFNGSNGFVSSNSSFSNPATYSEEAWFKTTTTQGGKIIGFGNNANGTSGSYDRHVYMQDNGQIVFGVWTGQANTITSKSPLNDGKWHHVVATQGTTGMQLYIDGALDGTNPQTGAQDYTGYWKVGGDVTWGSSSAYFAGAIDEAAVYPTVLSCNKSQDILASGRARQRISRLQRIWHL